MKKILLFAFALVNVVTGFAQLTKDGYYRIQNVGSTRYVYMMDNRGSINIGATTADLGAIELWNGFDRAASDPATSIYIKKVGDGMYRFHCQGTNSYEIVGYDLRIKKNRGSETYKAYQSKAGMTQYLCDAERSDFEYGVMGTNDPGTNYRDWYITPIKAQTVNYFGLTPEIKNNNGEQYVSFFAEFPFTFVSPNMKAFYVKKIERGMAIIEEVKGNEIAGAMPLIVKCASDKSSENQLELGANSGVKPSVNLLKGNYFFFDIRGTHRNVTPYNPETMRMLGLNKEGKLAFVKSDIKFLPANRAYLSVDAGTEDELLVVTQAQFDEITGVDYVITNNVDDQKVYSLAGIVVGESKDALKTLPAGVYVVSGKKYIVK